VAQQILAAKDTIRAAGKHCGLLATSNANLIERQEQGFRMLGLGIDSGFLLRALQEALATVGHQGMITSSFTASPTVADR
jgi:2-keto-3-deoxy-L-rhamnonate aldolase RhmA